MWLIIVLAVIVFLLMEHQMAFWLLFLPLGVLFLATIVGFFKNKRLAGLFWIVFVLMVIIIALILVAS